MVTWKCYCLLGVENEQYPKLFEGIVGCKIHCMFVLVVQSSRHPGGRDRKEAVL